MQLMGFKINMLGFKKLGNLVNFFNVQIPKYCMNQTSLAVVSAEATQVKFFSTVNKSTPSDKMTETLRLKFPLAKKIEVVDVSGGCGSMYEIFIESVEFKGLSMLKQHRLVNEILKNEIKEMHGLRIATRIPEGS